MDPVEHIAFVMSGQRRVARNINWLNRAGLLATALTLFGVAHMVLSWALNMNFPLPYMAIGWLGVGALIPILATRRIVDLRERELDLYLKDLAERYPQEHEEAFKKVNPEVWAMVTMCRDLLKSAPPMDGKLLA